MVGGVFGETMGVAPGYKGLFRFGLVVQRTKVYETDFDIQRGLLFGLSYRSLDLTACIFNLDDSHPMVVIGVGLSY